ncbi:DUF3164 family protein [Serratia fonticola]
MTTDIVIPDGYMKDRKGRLVPVDQVSAYDLEMDAFVRSQVACAKEHNQALKVFKSKSFDECYAWMDLVAEKYGRKPGGIKGNVTFSTFDGGEQITIKVQDTIEFGPELQVAKDIIDECVLEWSEGANDNLRAIIFDAFEVDQAGKLNVSRILSLRRIKIDDARWLKAMEAISESLQVAVSKTYINFKEKDGNGKLIGIPLDIAGV